MEPFPINLLGEELMVYPQEDETYEIYRGEKLWVTLIPNENEYLENGWTSLDLISSEYVQLIGRLIENKEE